MRSLVAGLVVLLTIGGGGMVGCASDTAATEATTGPTVATTGPTATAGPSVVPAAGGTPSAGAQPSPDGTATPSPQPTQSAKPVGTLGYAQELSLSGRRLSYTKLTWYWDKKA